MINKKKKKKKNKEGSLREIGRSFSVQPPAAASSREISFGGELHQGED